MPAHVFLINKITNSLCMGERYELKICSVIVQAV
jgi:hypothetical protein